MLMKRFAILPNILVDRLSNGSNICAPKKKMTQFGSNSVLQVIQFCVWRLFSQIKTLLFKISLLFTSSFDFVLSDIGPKSFLLVYQSPLQFRVSKTGATLLFFNQKSSVCRRLKLSKVATLSCSKFSYILFCCLSSKTFKNHLALKFLSVCGIEQQSPKESCLPHTLNLKWIPMSF